MREAKNSFFLLGKFDLTETEEGQLKALVEKFVVNPNWNSTEGTKYESDIAIAFLKDPVTFTNYILPICVNSALNSIDGFIEHGQATGIVSAWGITPISKKIDKAREILLPMVTDFECLASDQAYFYVFSAKTSYCAGKKEGNGNRKLFSSPIKIA